MGPIVAPHMMRSCLVEDSVYSQAAKRLGCGMIEDSAGTSPNMLGNNECCRCAVTSGCLYTGLRLTKEQQARRLSGSAWNISTSQATAWQAETGLTLASKGVELHGVRVLQTLRASPSQGITTSSSLSNSPRAMTQLTLRRQTLLE